MPTPAHADAPDASAGPDPTLARERAHLAASRAALRAMREDAESLDIGDVAANRVAAAALGRRIEKRVEELADREDTPLFFGRLDYEPPADPSETGDFAGERFHVGRRHVHDTSGDPMVVDWRAPVSLPFYRASRRDPLGVALRRRFGHTGGDLTAYEDEHLTDPDRGPEGGRLLQREIERPRVGPMRDIVATIQPEQDRIVRAGLGGTVCVQGGPGTGKTAVGLHRLAYLLYAHRERLARTGTLVVGPNRSFLHYIEQVLPALGELSVRQATVEDLVSHVTIRGTDTPAAAMIKGDARMAAVVRRALFAHVARATEPVVVVRGSRRLRIPAEEVDGLVTELSERGLRYDAGRAALPRRIAHAVLVRMEEAGEAPDDRVQDAVARDRAVKAAVRAVWPAVDPARLVLRLLSDADFLATHARGVLDAHEQRAIVWPRRPRSTRAAPWSPADAVLIDEAMDLVERTPSLGHVVLDEAQDLSPMQYRAVGRRCSTGSATVLGDLAQGTTPWATPSWSQALVHLGKADGVVEELTAGFRVPGDVIAYASRLIPHIAPDLTPVASARVNPGFFEVRATDPASGLTHTVAACREMLAREGSVGLIAADAAVPELAEALAAAGVGHLRPGEPTTPGARLALVPASLAKGLEYDHVVLAEPAAVVEGEPDERTGLRRLYVCLTRAVSGLIVTHARPLPARLDPTDRSGDRPATMGV
ncbi:AAA family ATPase [Streptomyces sp. HSG2]|uniref:HelD family protein n=1 Tax=Streptomyces sp. HSG2 TaxID=2797167 RepID=UPI001907F303|nr:AAA family ATPase [Streptomyces sp. HSG2]